MKNIVLLSTGYGWGRGHSIKEAWITHDKHNKLSPKQKKFYTLYIFQCKEEVEDEKFYFDDLGIEYYYPKDSTLVYCETIDNR